MPVGVLLKLKLLQVPFQENTLHSNDHGQCLEMYWWLLSEILRTISSPSFRSADVNVASLERTIQ